MLRRLLHRRAPPLQEDPVPAAVDPAAAPVPAAVDPAAPVPAAPVPAAAAAAAAVPPVHFAMSLVEISAVL